MRRNFLLIILLQLLVSCAPLSDLHREGNLLAYLPQAGDQSLLSLFQPIFIIEAPEKQFNRIGTPAAVLQDDGKVKVYVDPAKAVVYTEERKFETKNGTYTNLIYRIHFSETPFGLLPFQLSVGRNVGLFVIITLNGSNQPLLYTTVHTCGCYLAFIPTTYLPREAYPRRWPEITQVVYAEVLPSLLDPMLNKTDNPRLAIMIRSASHRVTDLMLADVHNFQNYPTSPIVMAPLSALEELPLPDTNRTTSFYETTGERKGFVKGSHKPIERILMSWWALDWQVGEDKKLGADKSEPPVFYTSLKPWARNESDMRDFNTFLRYWGWEL